MFKAGMTVRDAAHMWVEQMNAIPTDMIGKLMRFATECSYSEYKAIGEPGLWCEVTVPIRGDRGYDVEHHEACEIMERNADDETFMVQLDSGDVVTIDCNMFEPDANDSFLPMWGWMWSFGDPCDNWWLEEHDGIAKMSECGFRIFYNEDWGYFFGIDGAGYDFYEVHWIPLYEARGLRWHDDSIEEE